MAHEHLSVDSARILRDAFGTFATGVVIVTANHAGERLGATVSSFNSVSLDPPLISFSIARNAKAVHGWNNVNQFAVSVLAQSQADLSTRFARSLGDKWTGVSTFLAGSIDARLISGALLWFECEVYNRYDGGDHIMILGRVVAAMRNSEAAAPLLFFGGAYRSVAPHTQGDRVPDEAMWLHGW